MKPIKRSLLLAAVCSALVSGTRAHAGPVAADGVARDLLAEGVRFHSVLSGGSEVPATDSAATGSLSGRLTGTPGQYVFTFDLAYSGLTSDLLDAHLHYGIDPPGTDPRGQEGPVVFPIEDIDAGHATATWRSEDRPFPLTDSLVDSLFDGELYLNVHTRQFSDGEIRGQIGRDGVKAVPLPAPLAVGAAGLGLAALAKRKRLGVAM
jgi:hypothetical protein